jgi:hypothetical protein
MYLIPWIDSQGFDIQGCAGSIEVCLAGIQKHLAIAIQIQQFYLFMAFQISVSQ